MHNGFWMRKEMQDGSLICSLGIDWVIGSLEIAHHLILKLRHTVILELKRFHILSSFEIASFKLLAFHLTSQIKQICFLKKNPKMKNRQNIVKCKNLKIPSRLYVIQKGSMMFLIIDYKGTFLFFKIMSSMDKSFTINT